MTNQKKKRGSRHVNIFCIAPESTSQKEKFGIGLATNGIRAKLFTEDDACLAGADYTIRTSIIDGIINSVDVVTIDGNQITQSMMNQIRRAEELDKPIWCTKAVLPAVQDSNVKVYQGKLDELCSSIIEGK